MPTLTLYGGTPGHDAESGQIGGNKILLEWDDRAYFLDFGTNFAVTGRFYEEFLRPRGSALGLRDFLRMGLLPPLEGIYRDDLWVHEPDLWERYRGHPHYRRIDRLDGVLLSHAHVDHSGCLGFLKPEIPVYTGLMSATISKGMQDCRSGGPDAEYSYIQPREVKDDVLTAIRGAARRGRQHFICQTDDDITNAQVQLQAFWADHPGARTEIEAPPLATVDPANLGPHFFRVDHSIPGSAAFALETPIGWIVYSGDLRLHGHSNGAPSCSPRRRRN
jgi:ribonuclease J